MEEKKFVSVYRWGIEVKSSMGLYFSGLVFMKAISDAVAGRFIMDTLILMEMLLAAMLFAMVEACLFPRHREQTHLIRNTVLWVLLAQLVFVGGALLMRWFTPTPWWMALILVVTLELSLQAMWYGYHVALKQDTERLNRGLRRFQQTGE